MSNRFKPKGRALPVTCKHLLSAVVLIRIPTQHHPGQFKPVVAGHTTKLLKPDDIMLEKMQAVLNAKTLPQDQGLV